MDVPTAIQIVAQKDAKSPRPSSCAPVLRWHQGQALRVLRNHDTAGRIIGIPPKHLRD
jgi:hypothetical protein